MAGAEGKRSKKTAWIVAAAMAFLGSCQRQTVTCPWPFSPPAALQGERCAERHQRLHAIDLGHRRVADTDLAHIKVFTGLRKLRLESTLVTAAGLEAALPDLEVVW